MFGCTAAIVNLSGAVDPCCLARVEGGISRVSDEAKARWGRSPIEGDYFEVKEQKWHHFHLKVCISD